MRICISSPHTSILRLHFLRPQAEMFSSGTTSGPPSGRGGKPWRHFSPLWLATQHCSSPSPFSPLPAPGSTKLQKSVQGSLGSVTTPLSVLVKPTLHWWHFLGKMEQGDSSAFSSLPLAYIAVKWRKIWVLLSFWPLFFRAHNDSISVLSSSAKTLTLIHLRCQATFLNPRFRLHHTLPSFCPGSLRHVLLDGTLLLPCHWA